MKKEYDVLERDLKCWSGKETLINQIRIKSTIHIARKLFIQRDEFMYKKIFCMITLWLFALDDIFDSLDLSFEESEDLANSLIFRTAPSHGIVRMFNQIIDLGGYDSAKKDILLNLNEKTVRGMMKEKEVQMKGGFFENFDAYLSSSSYSIGTPIALSFVQFLDDRVVVANQEVLKSAGVITRLLNDIRSYQKEVQIEEQQNSITILIEGGMSYSGAVRRIDDIIDKELYLLEKKSEDLSGRDHYWSKLAYSLCVITREFYTHSDFHEYKTKNIQ